MPLTNRVDPFGELHAVNARGQFLGNRGGRFHQPDRTLGSRRWASRQWICCALSFKARRRHPIWGEGYTELFFLDEPTALAAGHRPCFECRRSDANAFAMAWPGRTSDRFPRAGEMDRVLHEERLEGGRKRRHRSSIDRLPDAAFVTFPDQPATAYALCGSLMLQWSADGYLRSVARPRGIQVEALTPPSIIGVLAAGYSPRWHATMRACAERHGSHPATGER